MKKIYNFIFLFILFLFSDLFSQVPIMNPILGSPVACAAPSPSTIYSVSATNSPIAYSWSVSPSAGVLIGSPNASITSISFPNSNANYTVSCSALNGFGISIPIIKVVSVFETPTVTFSGSNSFCQGSSTNISASSTLLSASSTISYVWSPGTGLNTTVGPNVIANPSSTTTYTVIGSIGFCSNSSVITVSVFPNPVITTTASSNPICQGNSTSLTASGANTYTWSNSVSNGIPFTPSATNTYSVIGKSVNGCTNTAMHTVIVNPVPVVSASTNSAVICEGLSATLTFGGSAQSYSLNSVSSPTSVVVSPSVTTTYTIVGVNSQGCQASSVLTQSVSACSGIFDLKGTTINYLKVYPNPGVGYFKIKSDISETVSIINEFGQLIKTIELSAGVEITVDNLSDGMYFIISPTTKVKVLLLH